MRHASSPLNSEHTLLPVRISGASAAASLTLTRPGPDPAVSTPDEHVFPECFCCPITFEPMVEPVVDGDGVSYERAAIVPWLAQRGVSPVTRNVCRVADLRTPCEERVWRC